MSDFDVHRSATSYILPDEMKQIRNGMIETTWVDSLKVTVRRSKGIAKLQFYKIERDVGDSCLLEEARLLCAAGALRFFVDQICEELGYSPAIPDGAQNFVYSSPPDPNWPPIPVRISEASKLLNVDESWLHEEIDAHRLPALRSYREPLVHVPTLAWMLNERAATNDVVPVRPPGQDRH